MFSDDSIVGKVGSFSILFINLCLSNVYVATTVLSLDWAYSNARLIARPDTEWLDP